jgi:hypothetical protein
VKQAVSRLTKNLGMLAVLGLTIDIAAGCAEGSAASDGDGGVSSSDGDVDAGSNIDASVDSSNGIDSGGSNDSGPSDDAKPSDDSGHGNDSGTDSGTDSGSNDAGPPVIFGATCPTGTIYTEDFTSDPVANGTFTSLIGPYTYNSGSHTISLSAGNPNTQLWIGARPSWTNYTLSVPVRIDSAGGNGGINFRMVSTPTSPSNNAGQMYFAGIATNQVLLGVENSTWTELAGPNANLVIGTFYTLQITANGSSLSVSVDGSPYVTNQTDGAFTFGSFGLRTYSSGMTYGTIKVTCN